MEFYQTGNGVMGVTLTLYGVIGGDLSTSTAELSDLD